VTLPACADPSFSTAGGTSASSVQSWRIELATIGTAAGPDFLAALEFDGAATLLAGFSAAVWMSTLVGAVYTDRLQLVSLTGAQPAGTRTASSLPTNTILPGVSRPWGQASDRMFLVMNDQYVVHGGSLEFQLHAQICSGVAPSGGMDCCAELTAKLDQVLAAVTRRYP